jgi:hypothetical protein
MSLCARAADAHVCAAIRITDDEQTRASRLKESCGLDVSDELVSELRARVQR